MAALMKSVTDDMESTGVKPRDITNEANYNACTGTHETEIGDAKRSGQEGNAREIDTKSPATPNVRGIDCRTEIGEVQCDQCFRCEKMSDSYEKWRNDFTVAKAKARCRKVRKSYSVGVLSSGGLLCTMAAIRNGFTPKWGTEIDPKLATLWTKVTGTACLGDTFKYEFDKKDDVVYLKSGQPCPDFSSSHEGGAPPGSAGNTGWQFVAQCDVIKKIRPKVFLIEMVANALKVNDGIEVDGVVDSMSQDYYVHTEVLKVSHFGDCSNRERLFIVGFHKQDVGPMGQQFAFPEGDYYDDGPIVARDVAVDDDDVPDKFWIQEDIEPFTPTRNPKPYCIVFCRVRVIWSD